LPAQRRAKPGQAQGPPYRAFLKLMRKPATEDRMDKVKVGVIGLGMGMYHLENFAKCPEAEIIAVADPNEGQMARAVEKYNPPHKFSDYQEMLKLAELDAVAVVTPNFLHKPMVLDCAQAGKHILCEKPMAMNAKDAQEMTDAANKAGLKLMMHFNQRFDKDSRYLKERIDAGDLGEIYHVKTGWIRRGVYASMSWMMGLPGAWFPNKAKSGGGALIDIGVHVLDLAMWLMGDVQPKVVFGTTFAKFASKLPKPSGMVFDVDDWASAYVKFDNGADLLLEASWGGFTSSESIYTHLFGTEGGADRVHGGDAPVLKIFKEINQESVDIVPKLGARTYETPQAHFVHAIQNNTKPLAPGEDGVRVMKVLDGIYESARTGEPVKV
jgi:predicted dehydrogenase